jgi:hypothetical protein
MQFSHIQQIACRDQAILFHAPGAYLDGKRLVLMLIAERAPQHSQGQRPWDKKHPRSITP